MVNWDCQALFKLKNYEFAFCETFLAIYSMLVFCLRSSVVGGHHLRSSSGNACPAQPLVQVSVFATSNINLSFIWIVFRGEYGKVGMFAISGEPNKGKTALGKIALSLCSNPDFLFSYKVWLFVVLDIKSEFIYQFYND